MSQPAKGNQSKPDTGAKPGETPWLWNVVLLDDNQHTDNYVIKMMQELFAHPPEVGAKLAEMVDKEGRVIVQTTHKELAELKRDQIHAYGKDPQLADSRGSMKAIIEPATK
jgi:ATP-dependent Clp protease adaptor protein ClpS